MSNSSSSNPLLRDLNPQQAEAASHGQGPLLVVAGAGTGKTATLVHRVAWLIAGGTDPNRILLLTFTRRAAAEMLRRVETALQRLRDLKSDTQSPRNPSARRYGTRVWGGTFHAIATRLLRRHGKALGLDPSFTIHDRSDSEDLINVVRTELGLAKTDRRFPKKGTCMSIYSRCVNSREKLVDVLKRHYPWCREWEKELKRLFDAYVDRKESASVLDYDDLLLYWRELANDPEAGPLLRKRFDAILVDEYQDTNKLQAEILHGLCPEGRGLTVVGDDAQSIYSFRAATVRNILDFPKQYPDTTVVTLEQNYRSTLTILEASNGVIGRAKERFSKNLWSMRSAGECPSLVLCEDEDEQADGVIRRILEHRESGIDLRRQAVLFRASHHSIVLEAELAARNIPFHKYGGLKFVETAHVKDLMAFLRLAENPRDVVAGSRVLGLLPGIGPTRARRLTGMLADAGGDFSVWTGWRAPAAAGEYWPKLLELLAGLKDSKEDLSAQVHAVRVFYAPLLERIHDHHQPRLRDLEQLEQVASRYRDRQAMISEITLDPPSSTQDLAGDPHLDEDYLILSTIHSAKGLEWDSVSIIHAADGNIPSDMATGSPEEIEEERRLFYVALTRAKNWLYVFYPLRYYQTRGRYHDRHGYAQMSRFLLEGPVANFVQTTAKAPSPDGEEVELKLAPRRDGKAVRQRTKDLWS